MTNLLTTTGDIEALASVNTQLRDLSAGDRYVIADLTDHADGPLAINAASPRRHAYPTTNPNFPSSRHPSLASPPRALESRPVPFHMGR